MLFELRRRTYAGQSPEQIEPGHADTPHLPELRTHGHFKYRGRRGRSRERLQM